MSANPATSRDVSLGRHAALRPRERLVVDIGGVENGVFFVGEAMRAYLNRCPHMGGPACQGKLMPRTLEVTATDGRSLGPAFSQTDRHIVCPWHGYEFDVLTGLQPVNSAMRLMPVPVRVADGEVLVTVHEARA
jgi:nitrite reductase/ring-hydroxylating ferredoxin subunit